MPDNTSPKPYKLAVLKPEDRDLSKRFYIEFYVWDENQNEGEGALVRKQYRAPAKHKTVKEIEAWALPVVTKINDALLSGKYIRREDPEEDISNTPLGVETTIEAFERIRDLLQYQIKPDTDKDYRLGKSHFNQWLKENGYRKLKLVDLTPSIIVSYLDDYQADNGVSNITRNNRLRNLSAMCGQMVERDWIEENPFIKVKKNKEAKSQKYPFTEKHLQILVPELKKHRHKQLWQASQFIYYLFVRPSELEHMKVHQIDFTNLNVMVPNTFKSGEVKHPDICPDLLQLMKDMNLEKAHPEWYVFGSKGVPGPTKRKKSYFTKKFADIRDAFELPKNYTFYCWKHTGNLHFLMNGGSLTAAQKQNGHKTLSTTEVYAKSIGYNFNMEIRARQNGAILDAAFEAGKALVPSADIPSS